MAGFQASAVVQIYEGQQALGSGYALGNGRVLTARHVVGTRTQVEVRGEGESAGTSMVVVWLGDAEADVAVLGPPGAPLAAEGPPTVWFFEGDPRGREWSARGFPAVLRDRAEPVSGKVELAQDPDGPSCTITVEAPPPEAKDWLGMSGSAAFVGDRLFAVLRSVPKLFVGKKLRAVPVARLLRSIEGLRAALGLPTLDDRRCRTVDRVAAKLRDVPALRSLLAEVRPSWSEIAGEPARLSEAVLDDPSPAELATCFKTAMFRLKRAGGPLDTAATLVQVFELALPCVVASRTGAHFGPSSGELNRRYPQTTEPYLAWERGGSMKMRPAKSGKPPKDPVPDGYVEIYSALLPEDGAGQDAIVEAMTEDLASRSKKIAKEWFEREGDEGTHARESWQERISYINFQMKAVEELTYFALAHGADRASEQELVRLLAEQLDSVRVIVPRLTPQDVLADQELLASLTLFYRYHAELVGGGS